VLATHMVNNGLIFHRKT